jgi:glutathione S-transferase
LHARLSTAIVVGWNEAFDELYKTRLLEPGDQDKSDYRALQPFGQVPTLEEDGLVLFESGAIVLHIGERSEMLLPKDASGRARATQWLIAALNSIEPFVMNVALIDLFYKNEEWAKLRRPGGSGVCAEAPVRTLQVARRQTLPRW